MHEQAESRQPQSVPLTPEETITCNKSCVDGRGVSITCGCGHCHHIAKSLDGSWADAVHAIEVFEIFEQTVGLAIFDDPSGQHRAHTREQIQFRCGSGVQIDQPRK